MELELFVYFSPSKAVGMKNRRQTESEEVEIGKGTNASVRVKFKDVKRRRNPAHTWVGCFKTGVLYLGRVKNSQSLKKKTQLPLNNL